MLLDSRMTTCFGEELFIRLTVFVYVKVYQFVRVLLSLLVLKWDSTVLDPDHVYLLIFPSLVLVPRESSIHVFLCGC